MWVIPNYDERDHWQTSKTSIDHMQLKQTEVYGLANYHFFCICNNTALRLIPSFFNIAHAPKNGRMETKLTTFFTSPVDTTFLLHIQMYLKWIYFCHVSH